MAKLLRGIEQSILSRSKSQNTCFSKNRVLPLPGRVLSNTVNKERSLISISFLDPDAAFDYRIQNEWPRNLHLPRLLPNISLWLGDLNAPPPVAEDPKFSQLDDDSRFLQQRRSTACSHSTLYCSGVMGVMRPPVEGMRSEDCLSSGGFCSSVEQMFPKRCFGCPQGRKEPKMESPPFFAKRQGQLTMQTFTMVDGLCLLKRESENMGGA
ncbi:hypothetical protein NPIL_477381 [Nephila pilipes]|uniref:Uncharacterized protein n=1 Tax=Nephila pilipes TaxID=299642 RepID=A0A8X6U8I0_NEPPI|nr:hypothetical protein NPIL_477381 [Nephila pilipes]